MLAFRSAIAALLLAAALHAEPLEPLLTRPVTLSRGSVDLVLHGTYTNWDSGLGNQGPSTFTGGTFALGVDFGVADSLQLGLATAFPIAPAQSFGSVIGSALVGLNRDAAVRLDVGLERIGINGGDAPSGSPHATRYFAGAGVRARFPIGPGAAFVVGRAGAVEFGAFNNIGDGSAAIFTGASASAPGSADLVAISDGDEQSGTAITVSLPVGLLLQPAPAVGITLQTGYAATILPSNTTATSSIVAQTPTAVLHYIPLDLEVAVLTPVPSLELGARLLIDGFVGFSGVSGSGPGYFDQRSVMFWLRLHG